MRLPPVLRNSDAVLILTALLEQCHGDFDTFLDTLEVLIGVNVLRLRAPRPLINYNNIDRHMDAATARTMFRFSIDQLAVLCVNLRLPEFTVTTCHQRVVKMRGNCGVTVDVVMADEGKKRKANEIAEDADDSVEEAEAPAQQVEVVDLTAESDDDGEVTPSEDAAEVARRKADWEAKAAVKRERLGQLEQQAAADLVKS
ncbi:hypothetical protein DYB28_014350, partial [Aphanomyces astaci]